ncbi:hypothetical protein V5N34_35035 [Streptomyces baarnensis]|uniref:hypothetical protein n=1 Tax=Streptomyces baarnensis TaxID=66872 RepID=UPI003081D73B
MFSVDRLDARRQFSVSGDAFEAAIDLVEEVRDFLADSRLPHYEDASDDHAASCLTDALTEPGADQAALLAQERIHPPAQRHRLGRLNLLS